MISKKPKNNYRKRSKNEWREVETHSQFIENAVIDRNIPESLRKDNFHSSYKPLTLPFQDSQTNLSPFTKIYLFQLPHDLPTVVADEASNKQHHVTYSLDEVPAGLIGKFSVHNSKKGGTLSLGTYKYCVEKCDSPIHREEAAVFIPPNQEIDFIGAVEGKYIASVDITK